MYAIVANGIAKVVKTQRELELLSSIYPYPKFRKVATLQEGYQFLSENSRKYNSIQHVKYGNIGERGYVSVEYFITKEAVYYNIFTDKFGFMKVQAQKGVKVDGRRDLIKVCIDDIELDDFNLHHHLIAIKRILSVIGEFVNVDIIVPDISVFLAITQYKGTDYRVVGLRKLLATRVGSYGITVQRKVIIG